MAPINKEQRVKSKELLIMFFISFSCCYVFYQILACPASWGYCDVSVYVSVFVFELEFVVVCVSGVAQYPHLVLADVSE